MTTDPAAVGTRVLAALARGRDRQLERRRQRAADLREFVLRAARLDRASGRPERGRAGRVARCLARNGIAVSEKWVGEIIRNCGADTSAKRASAVL